MKKFFMLIALGFAAISGLQAQESKSETLWVGRVGLNVMNTAGKDAKELESKMGYDLSASFQKGLGMEGMYWGMEFALGSRGNSYEEGGYSQKTIAHNIRWSPFTFGYKYALNDKIKLDAHLGAFASFDYAGKSTSEYGDEEESVKISDWDDYNRFDAGMALGVGVWYDRYNLDLSWQRGFVEAYKDTKMYTSNFMIRLGIAF